MSAIEPAYLTTEVLEEDYRRVLAGAKFWALASSVVLLLGFVLPQPLASDRVAAGMLWALCGIAGLRSFALAIQAVRLDASRAVSSPFLLLAVLQVGFPMVFAVLGANQSQGLSVLLYFGPTALWAWFKSD